MRAGFSLIEVLVATATLAIAGLLGVGMLAGTLSSREALTERQAQLADVDTLRLLLRDDLGQLALRPTRTFDGRATPIVLAGSEAGVDVWGEAARDGQVLLALTRRGWANPGGIRARSSLQRVEYVLTGEGLVRRATGFPDAVAGTPQSERLLLSGTQSVELEFLVGTHWLAQGAVSLAPGAGPVPRAMRLRYEMPGLGEIEHVVLIGETA
ncbi:type II secretion system minor pseudopilin GspJ [Hyphobacterium marinum]|uniref:Type II secretion system protein J n=1 Tax=Hyphobacterium marinum TaxID=3116574 RepID=A0ABU7LW65_9PROT|nr:type II secretion system minor pseudopilin GspJ [Hyphobacterium sp. Y6023]MEE2565764.1 type II secretion system minor pseudopilin GspJ [Hyphobacterium sp. Y6023]